jgi:hypothetical protein
MGPEMGPVGGTHGLVADSQIWPTLAFPFAMPLTDHVTLVSGAFVTASVNEARWPGESVAAGGKTLTATLLVIVTVADATADEFTVAWIVTGLAEGRSAGAV